MKKNLLLLEILLVAVSLLLQGVALAAPTPLSVTLGEPDVACNADGESATVTTHYTVISGNASPATMTASIGDADYQLPVIDNDPSTVGDDWIIGGNSKMAEDDFIISLENGTYSLTICADHASKTACSDPAMISVDCASSDPCASVGAFGEVPANKNLCKANGHIEIQFRGSFGDSAELTISNNYFFSKTVYVDKAGDSCNYHYNWDPSEDGIANAEDAGTYSFEVNIDAYSFSADLICDDGNGKPN